MSKVELPPSPTEIRANNRRRKSRLDTRRESAARKARIFDHLVRGMPHLAIAHHENCSLQAVRRIIARELDSRRIDPATDFAKLQIARLNHALMVVNCQMIDGDAAALDRLLKVLAELDRYHGVTQASASAGAFRQARERIAAPIAAVALPAPSRDAAESEARQIRIASL